MHSTLIELQELDRRIADAEDRVKAFEPLFAEVEQPALQLEQEVNTTRARLQEMKLDERRLELSLEEKRQRSKKLQERLNIVRNVREEAAVTAELHMLKRAVEGDEQEAFTLLDQIRKLEQRLQEQSTAFEEARTSLDPRRHELAEAKQAAELDLASLRETRDRRARAMAPKELRMYEGIRGRGRRRAVAELTADGACGNCYSMIPLQLQNEVRNSGAMIRCEGCGVILTVVREG